MTPEGKVKKAIRDMLDSERPNLKYYMPEGNGVADFVVCAGGTYLEIEAKSVYTNHKLTGRQRLNAMEVLKANGQFWLIDETIDLSLLRDTLHQMVYKRRH